MNGFSAFIRTFGAGRLAAMGAVTLIMVGFFAYIILRWSTPSMAPLFSELSMRDSNAIIRELERAGVAYNLRQEGSTLLVPSSEVARLRMKLAEQGLPTGGGVGYEIFDKSEALGTTSFVQNINHLRALEGELARSVREIDRVQSARVHLVMPERALFARDSQQPTASIVLKLRGDLQAQQVKAIQHLVASAVPGMKPSAVSIIDETGRLLATGREEGFAVSAEVMDEKAQGMEARLQAQVNEIVARIVGQDRARVQVTAELDYNRVTETQDMYDPEGRVVRSSQTTEEKNDSLNGQGGQVSVSNELPGAAPAGSEGGQSKDTGTKASEIINYEISRKQRTEVLEAGRIKRLSVAVLVDGLYTKEGDNVTYAERPKEELDRIASLVRSAIGFDAKRGDTVEVVNLRFAEAPKGAADSAAPPAAAGLMPAFSLEDYFRMAELGVLFILGTLLVLFGLRPLVRTMLNEAGSGTHEPASAAAQGNESSGQTAPVIPPPAPRIMPPVDNATSRALDEAMMTGSAHKNNVERVGDLVKTNPREATAVVRAWMTEAKAQHE